MQDYKIWNSDLGKVFIERQERLDITKSKKICPKCGTKYKESEEECPFCSLDPKDQNAVTAEKQYLGRGGQAIDRMINGPINKEYNGMIKKDSKK